MSTNLSFAFPVTTCRVGAGCVRTLIALHHGHKTKSESFASCRGRVNISGSSKIAWINVECNEDSLSVAVPSKVKVFAGLRDSCYSSVTNSLLGGNWRDSERIKTAALPKNLCIWQQSHSQPMAVWIIIWLVVKNVKPSKFIFCNSLQTKIVRHVEFNTFAWSFLVSNTESESEMFSEIRPNGG